MLKWFRDRKARRILEDAGYCPVHLTKKTTSRYFVWLCCEQCVAEEKFEYSRRVEAALAQLKADKHV